MTVMVEEIQASLPNAYSEIADLLARSPLTLGAVIDLGRRLRRGKVRVREVIRDAPNEGESFDEQGRAEQVVKLIDKIRRLDRDNEHLTELMTSKTRKVSEGKRKEFRDAVARNETAIAETLSEVKLNKRQIERIVEKLREMIERVDKIEREGRQIENRVGMPVRKLKKLFRDAENEGQTGLSARKKLKTLGLSDEEIAQVARTVAAAPRKVRRVEDQVGISTSDAIELHERLSRATAMLPDAGMASETQEPGVGPLSAAAKTATISETETPSDAQGEAGPAAPERTRRAGQAYVEDPRVRRAIELHAMTAAKAHYVAAGFTVEDTSATRSFDLLCRRGDEEVRVEVKGTRSDGTEVFVTAAEVLNARGDRWRTDLFVLRSVRIARCESNELAASGGEPRVIEGWSPDDADLAPTQYRYLLPVEGPTS